MPTAKEHQARAAMAERLAQGLNPGADRDRLIRLAQEERTKADAAEVEDDAPQSED